MPSDIVETLAFIAYGESRRVVIDDDRERKSDASLYEKIDEARLDRSVADERLTGSSNW